MTTLMCFLIIALIALYYATVFLQHHVSKHRKRYLHHDLYHYDADKQNIFQHIQKCRTFGHYREIKIAIDTLERSFLYLNKYGIPVKRDLKNMRKALSQKKLTEFDMLKTTPFNYN